jgi:probable rRNA maturation factor
MGLSFSNVRISFDMKKAPAISNGPVVMFHDYRRIALPINSLMMVAKLIYKREKIPLSQKTHAVFCSNFKIAKLNSMFRNKNRPTDVLSFNYNDSDLFGEIYISLERARAQAKQYNVTCGNEIVRLFVHGMIHLLGFDHETINEKKKMEAMESKYLQYVQGDSRIIN